MLEAEQTSVPWYGWKAEVYYLMGSRTRDRPAYSIAIQSSILKLQLTSTNSNNN
jgi:hypothetical protein